MAQQFRLVKYYNLPRYNVIYLLDPTSTIFPSYSHYISHYIPHYVSIIYHYIDIPIIYPLYSHHIFIYYILVYIYIERERERQRSHIWLAPKAGDVGPKDLRFILKDGAGPDAKLLAEGRIGLAEHLPWVSDPSKARPILGSWDLGYGLIWGLPTTTCQAFQK